MFAKTTMVAPSQALPGRQQAVEVPDRHAVLATPPAPPYPHGSRILDFGMGCFWGAERGFWQLGAERGIVTTAVGYAGGYTPNPTYEEVCSGRTGHAEVVRVVFDPAQLSDAEVLTLFWEGHDPTQGMRQGNDTGTQYRSAVYYHDEAQLAAAQETREAYQKELDRVGYGEITTETAASGPFYFAEAYHQQYLAKNPFGYSCHTSTGVPFPMTH